MPRILNRLSSRTVATIKKPGRHADGGGLSTIRHFTRWRAMKEAGDRVGGAFLIGNSPQWLVARLNFTKASLRFSRPGRSSTPRPGVSETVIMPLSVLGRSVTSSVYQPE